MRIAISSGFYQKPYSVAGESRWDYNDTLISYVEILSDIPKPYSRAVVYLGILRLKRSFLLLLYYMQGVRKFLNLEQILYPQNLKPAEADIMDLG